MTRHLTLILAIAGSIISGCAAYDPAVQRYEVMYSKEVSEDEAVNFLRAQHELDIARRNSRHSGSNHPALVGSGGLQFSSLTIRERESLLSVANRLMAVANYSRLIYDLTDKAPSPDNIYARSYITIDGGPTAFGEIASTYHDQFPGVQLYAAIDGGGHALVISDKGYPRWSILSAFEVQAGKLSDNVQRLSQFIGWDVPPNGWNAADYPIPHGYPIIIEPENPRSAITALLAHYPVQAQLNQNTRLVTVVGRPSP